MEPHIDPASLLKEIYSSTSDFAIFTQDNEGRVRTWSQAAERMLGYPESEVIGMETALFFTPEDRVRQAPQREMDDARSYGRASDYRWHLRKNGSWFWADGVLTPLHDAQGRQSGYLKIMKDVTERKLADEAMQRLATVDPLTGLANRNAFDTRLAEMIAMSLRSGQLLILQLLDLDHFKHINDTLGHHAGDMLLQQVARRMQGVMRDSDFIARLGGDEFAIIQLNMASVQAGGYLAAKLLDALDQPFDIDSHQVRIGASMGIAVCPHDAASPGDMRQKADLALYRSKREGRNCFHYFTEELDAAIHARNLNLLELRNAVERKEFWLEYQPKIRLADGQPMAVEALLRCSNPRLAAYPIEDIITLASEAGLMQKIGVWTIGESCCQLRRLKNLGFSDLRMCINLCSRELAMASLPSIVQDALARFGLAPAELEIEITERQAIEVKTRSIDVLTTMSSRGIIIALDDFGTGYSALSYLNDLPVSALKLDKSFLSDIPDNAQKCEIAKAVIQLALALGLEVIAEGVESDEQLAFCQQQHCTGAQGYLFSRPLSQDEIATWLLTHARHGAPRPVPD